MFVTRQDDSTQGWCAVCEIYTSGTVIIGSGNVRVNSRGVAQMNSTVQSSCGHLGTLTATAKNRANGLNIGRINDTFTGVYSGYVVTGSGDVRSQ